jgi:hypothetical protein
MKRGSFRGELFVLTYVIPTTPSRPFVVGDLVDVMSRDGKRASTVRVMRAGKRTIKTRCGRTWMQNGYWKGENGSWPFPWVRHSRRKTEVP